MNDPTFSEYVKMLDRLDEIEVALRNGEYGQSNAIKLIDEIRKRYEIALIECGDYPTI